MSTNIFAEAAFLATLAVAGQAYSDQEPQAWSCKIISFQPQQIGTPAYSPASPRRDNELGERISRQFPLSVIGYNDTQDKVYVSYLHDGSEDVALFRRLHVVLVGDACPSPEAPPGSKRCVNFPLVATQRGIAPEDCPESEDGEASETGNEKSEGH